MPSGIKGCADIQPTANTHSLVLVVYIVIFTTLATGMIHSFL